MWINWTIHERTLEEWLRYGHRRCNIVNESTSHLNIAQISKDTVANGNRIITFQWKIQKIIKNDSAMKENDAIANRKENLF